MKFLSFCRINELLLQLCLNHYGARMHIQDKNFKKALIIFFSLWLKDDSGCNNFNLNKNSIDKFLFNGFLAKTSYFV